MTQLYHITNKGPRVCKAQIRSCKYSKNGGGGHYTDQASAQAVYEKQLSKKYGEFGTYIAQTVNESKLQKFYRAQERLESSHPTVAAIVTNYRVKRALRNANQDDRGRGSQGSRANRHKLAQWAKRKNKQFVRKQMSHVKRAIQPNAKNLKKWLLVKYWMPDIHSNRWR